MKILFVKKSFIISLAIIVTLAVVIGLSSGFAAADNHADNKIIVIDAGHGGVDAGVVGIKTQTKESDINLSISKKLKGYFVDAGFSVVMTRVSNGGLYGLPTNGFKRRDMTKRKDIIENSGADMVISVHQNYCPISSRRGGQTFFNPDSENGKNLADCIQKELNSLCGIKNYDALAGDYFMLKCTQNPSVIVECGFLSNAEDEKLLISDEYQEKIAYSIFKGAVSFYC